MKNNPLVSIIIPSKNSSRFLEATLLSIKSQTYSPIEILIIDSKSTDQTLPLGRKYKSKVYEYIPKVAKGTFDAPYKRNYGVAKAHGKYVYCVDADMVLPRGVIEEAVALCENGFDALVVPEESFGEGIWSRAKALERRCFWGDRLIESPRFFKKIAWTAVGGVDESLVSGRDDGDLYQKLLEQGFRVGRTKGIIRHNEGKLTLKKQFYKKVMYGKDVLSYIKKRPVIGILSYSPIRLGFFKNWKLFVKNPVETGAFIILKTVENVGGIVGIVISIKDRLSNII